MVALDQSSGNGGVEKQTNQAYILKIALKEFAFRWIWGISERKKSRFGVRNVKTVGEGDV